MEEFLSKTIVFVSEHPTICIVGVITLGFLITMAIRKSKPKR